MNVLNLMILATAGDVINDDYLIFIVYILLAVMYILIAIAAFFILKKFIQFMKKKKTNI